MSAELLVRLNADRKLEAREIADLLNLAQSSVYRYFIETELRHGQLRTLIRHIANRDAAELLARSLIDGTEFALMRVPASADFDGDGDVDSADVLDGAIKVNKGVGQLLEQIHESMTSAPVGRINPDDCEALASGVSQLLGWLGAVQRIISDESARQARRRKAHPFPVRVNGHRAGVCA